MTEPNYFVDTNILVYAFDKKEPKKHEIAKRLLEKVWQGKESFYTSNQILAELSRVLIQKVEKPYTPEIVSEIINTFKIKEWIIFNYSINTINFALEIISKHRISFWDALIAATMLENNVYQIYSEDSSLSIIQKIKVTNPFK